MLRVKLDFFSHETNLSSTRLPFGICSMTWAKTREERAYQQGCQALSPQFSEGIGHDRNGDDEGKQVAYALTDLHARQS